jgi:exonuclease SbcC
MIIQGVQAENVLKYAVLRLEDIPAAGLIAVIGDNESGKSSIGESICFALFGRTFSLDPGDLDKVIRWGESRCSIRLDFTTPDGQGYRIARFLDELGNHGASISRSGEQPMVRGVDEVAAALRDIIGFGYTEFIESFYLAQREITTPHPHSFAVKAMAGVDVLERVGVTCREEIERARRQSHEINIQQGDIQTQIAAIGLEPGYLASLEDERADLDAALEGDRKRIAALKAGCEHNDTALATIEGSAEDWLSVPARASLRERRTQWEGLRTLLGTLHPRYAKDVQTAEAFGDLERFSDDLEERLVAVEALFGEADNHRSRLGRLLGEAEGGADTADKERGLGAPAEAPDSDAAPEAPPATFAERRSDLQAREARARSGRRAASLLWPLSLVLALAGWGALGLLALAPDSPQAQPLAAWLAGLVPDWQTRLLPWLPYGAGGLTLLFVAFLARGAQWRRRRQDLADRLDTLGEDEETARGEFADLSVLGALPLPEACARIGGVREPALALRAADLRDGLGAALVDPEAHTAYQGAFKRRLRPLQQGIAALRTAAAKEIEGLHESVSERVAAIARLDGAIERERQRVKRHNELTGISELLQAKIDELGRRVRVRELATDLLAGAIHYISQRFNTEIRNLAADSLPKFTNGRYEHLQIDENLKVKAFSSEKRNFMELDEISSGTQRQIMLAVRLALSQKLVNSVIQGPQMVFLDEPFAFFDEGRTASALAVLPQVSRDFTQIWVTSQTFPANSHFDLCIECTTAESHSPKVWRPGATEGTFGAS